MVVGAGALEVPASPEMSPLDKYSEMDFALTNEEWDRECKLRRVVVADEIECCARIVDGYALEAAGSHERQLCQAIAAAIRVHGAKE